MLDKNGLLVENYRCGLWRFRYDKEHDGHFEILSTCRLSSRVLARHCFHRFGSAKLRNYKSLVPACERLDKFSFIRLICDSDILYNWNDKQTDAAKDQRFFDDLERRFKICCNYECAQKLSASSATEICFFFGASSNRVSFYICATCKTEKCISAVKRIIAMLFPLDPFNPKVKPHNGRFVNKKNM